MRIADLPNPAPGTIIWVTSVEPWQREGLLRIREELGVDADALLRAGVTLALSIVGAITPDATTPPAGTEGASNLKSPQTQVCSSIPPACDSDEEQSGGRRPD
jgi:hypothetical protein